MRNPVILLIASMLLAAPAATAAEPCVGTAFDRPFPGAKDVEMHQTDVRAADFPGVWQEGTIEGRFYQIFANKVAVLQAERSSNGWSVVVDCKKRPCAIALTRNPPDEAKKLSKKFEQCLTPPEAADADPKGAQKSNAESDAKHASFAMLEVKSAAPAKKPKVDAKIVSDKNASASAPVALQAMKKTQPTGKLAAGQPSNSTRTFQAEAARPADPVWVSPQAIPANRPKAQPKPKAASKPNTIALEGLGEVVLAGKPFYATVVPASAKAGSLSTDRHVLTRTGEAGADLVCLPVVREKPAEAAPACGKALVPASSPVETMQRLLVLAGADPGEIDGNYGSKTEKAIHQVLGKSARYREVSKAIAAVDAILCGRKL